MALTQAEMEQSVRVLVRLLSASLNLSTSDSLVTAPVVHTFNASSKEKSEQISTPTVVRSVSDEEQIVQQPISDNIDLVNVPQHPTISQWLAVYEHIISTGKDYKAQTIKNKLSVTSHIHTLWGNFHLDQLRPHKISQDIRESFLPEKSSTAGRVLAELKLMYCDAIANGWTNNNPAIHLKQPKHKTIRTRLSLDVWKTMYSLSDTHPQPWVKCLLALALITGQRRGDLQKMKFADVSRDEFGNEYLRVEQLKEAGKGYGARVEIPLDLRMNEIGLTLRTVIEMCKTAGKSGSTLLRKSNGEPVEASSLSARFAELVCAADANVAQMQARQRPSLHEVRSLSARTYASQGLDIQTLLGHKSPEITEIYKNTRGLDAKQWKRVHV